jgi:predicted TIM-barrel fold metal-dependent hydrolase
MSEQESRIIENLMDQIDALKTENKQLELEQNPIEIFDPHFHVWDITEGGPADGNILGPVEGNKCFHIGLYEAHLDKVPAGFKHVGGTFLEAASVCYVDTPGPEHQNNCLAEAEWVMADVAVKSTRTYAFCPSACLEDPDVAATLEKLAAMGPVRGIRQILNYEPSWPRNGKLGNLLDNAQFAKGYAILAKYNFSFDAQLNPPQFKQAAELFGANPSVPVVINHLGTPSLADLTEDGKKQQFWDGMAALAALPYVTIKISMLGYIDKKWNENTVVADAVHRIISLFGLERCIVASNHPSDLTDNGWTAYQNYEAFGALFSQYSLEQQRMLYGGNAKRIYRA